MASTETRKEYMRDYIKEKYEYVSILFENGMKERLTKHAEKNGESLNAYIVRLIKEDMMERWY